MPVRLLAVLLAVLCATTLVSCGDDESSGAVSCEYPTDGSEPARDVEPPPTEATETGAVDVTISTSAGEVGATLDAAAAPCTVNSFLSLAEQGYFDDTPCHRLTTEAAGIFVLQCGDPTGSSGGGPGYTFADELSGDEQYTGGTMAMANGGAGTNTNGSQFFIVYDDTPLPPDYTVFGKVDDAGLKVVQDVAAKGTANGAPDGPPKEPVQIESVVVD
jgi:peptidyl-prolyl cis-trans isomerase B (cyclophilin B)